MPERVLVDNDVALKMSCYALVEEMLAATTVDGVAPAMLGVARYVIRARLERARNVADRVRARGAFERLLAIVGTVEPDATELAMAAEMEAESNRRDLELDGGESQLLAVLVNRRCGLLLTGDKRAIAAMAAVAPAEVGSRVACLEQLIAHVVSATGVFRVREGVCAEPQVDRATTACFGCSSGVPPAEGEVLTGLASYIYHLNRSAPGVLLPGTDLAGAAP